jgi:predicted RNase H-like HicB family nuclease
MTKYAIVFEAPERPEGNWCAYAPDLPGTAFVGDTLEECRENALTGIAAHIDALKRFGYPVPAPTTRVEELSVAA